jgi:DNA invertase Pin-like site-specific DNA recombinase
MEQFVTYTRVSTKRQGRSGLGLEAQQRDMDLYFTNYATEPYEIIGQYCDIESGMKSDNVQFNLAVELAKRTGATLLVAKLDRISRRVSVIAALMEEITSSFISLLH